MPASVPPATITSASPRRITSAASPMACVPAAQAVVTVLEWPSSPSWMVRFPAAMFGSIFAR